MKKKAGGRGRKIPLYTIFQGPRLCTNPLPIKHPITIQHGGNENLVYQGFRFKITPALQATKEEAFILLTTGTMLRYSLSTTE